jgi:hypothetical protein
VIQIFEFLAQPVCLQLCPMVFEEVKLKYPEMHFHFLAE